LLDLIRLNKGFHGFRETLEEARFFLREPQRVRSAPRPRVIEPPRDTVAAAEGIETVLSLLSLFPALPMAAGLSSAHLAAIRFPPGLRRLYLLRDNDAAGDFAEDRLVERCREAGIECRVLKPRAKDLNADLRADPAHAVNARMIAQLAPEDRSRFRP
jgi:hypothetical protein